jgi:hypothetical protein
VKFAQCPECRAFILVLPDLKAMRKAVEDHAKCHSDPGEVAEILSQRVLVVVARSQTKC